MNILFVCTGNTCRSPMAEAMLRSMAKQANVDLTVRSAGVSALDHMPIAEQSKQVLRQKGITDSLTSQSLTAELVEWSTIILTMTQNHKRQLLQMYPDSIDKTFTLKEYVYKNEPAGQDRTAWEQWNAELQAKQALGQPITEQDEAKLEQLAAKVLDEDIADPFGGPLEVYRFTADEIEQLLAAMLERWQAEGFTE